MSEWLMPLQTLINDALRYDLAAEQKLSALAGKTLVLAVSEPALTMSMTIEANGFVFLQSGTVDAFDARVSGKAKDLFAVMRAQDRTAAMMAHEIHIQGDTRTFFSIQDVLAQLDIDWEMALADKIGDLAAHVVADGLRFFGSIAKNHLASFSRTSRNFLREESGWFVQSSVWRTHTQAVQTARQDVDRIAAKIRRLEQQWQAKRSERD
ncbi:MAG: SCP2 sterol-binding domain-containing protein [Reinekea sp.]|jgi:ubiquinone biosynthesis protein UbiJ|nr:SCP2 sterol-binding domain-containing protein [Reinekea sp.]MDX1474105.1 SCP2 sterol-binding domain-containing protein [Reinekea sp.]